MTLCAAATAAASFIQCASAGVTLTNFYSAANGNPAEGGANQLWKMAVKFTTGSGSNWSLSSIKARLNGTGNEVGVQIWTDGATGSDPTGPGASALANSSRTLPWNSGWSLAAQTFDYASTPVQLEGGKSYWAVFTTMPTYTPPAQIPNWLFSIWGGSALPTSTNGSGWSLGQSLAIHQSTSSYGWNDTWSPLQGWVGNSMVNITPEIEFNAIAVAPAPGALALLGIAGISRRRRRVH